MSVHVSSRIRIRSNESAPVQRVLIDGREVFVSASEQGRRGRILEPARRIVADVRRDAAPARMVIALEGERIGEPLRDRLR